MLMRSRVQFTPVRHPPQEIPGADR